MYTRRSVLVPLLLSPLSPRLLISESQPPGPAASTGGPGEFTRSGGSPLAGEEPQSLTTALQALETRSHGRLGCAVLDLANGKRTGYRLDERFPMCSTFKFLATAFILRRADDDKEQMGRRITYARADLLSYAPITQQHVSEGMTIMQLCEAAMTMSDNTAANLLLASFGGPPALNTFLRSIGDTVTRLDRIEPTLNGAAPGDPRDTTTPAAMLEDLRRILFGDVLNFSCRALLTNWLIANKTGDARIRAGLPRNWKAGDKTGSGEHGTTNDIAVLWPPHRAPVLVTAYLTQSTLDSDARNAILADVGRAIANSFATT